MTNPDTRSPEASPEGGKKKFGTIEGVFLPNVLTMLGVIMYLRQGMVMGEAGLLYGLLIIVAANVVTFTTALSLSSVSTNMRVKAGGAYYIISRSLGIEWGGCIGIPLALSQTLAISLNTIGFAESLKMLSDVGSLEAISPIAGYPMWLLGTITLGLMAVISLKGSAVVLKTQYVVLALVALSLVAFFAGGIEPSASGPHLIGEFKNFTFWQVFAIFFPAVTGIMSGVSLSGDLKDPRSAIPRGTILSIVTVLIVYAAVGVFLCFAASPETLSRDSQVFLKIAWRPEPILFGLWAAAISSGLGMILAAPRTIQALANDGVLPKALAKTTGKNEEPMIAMVLCLIIAEAAILMGKLDLVAPVLSMFFLVTYGMLNLIAGLETLVDNPSYRPTLRTPWYVSLFGAACCFAVMFLINMVATIVAFAVITIIYLLLKRRRLHATWGDLRRGFWLSLVRRSLLQVERLPEHPKNWRPNVMVLTRIPQGRLDLVDLADWLGSRRGLVTLHHVLEGPYSRMRRRAKMAFNNLDRFIKDNALNALPAVDVVEDRSADLRKIIASQGFGSFQPNTVMLDWAERDELKPGQFEDLCQGVIVAEKTLLVLHVDRDRKFGERRRIDIWVEIDSMYLPMMLLLGYLISQDEEWETSRIHVRLLRGDSAHPSAEVDVRKKLDESRIPMEPEFHDDMSAADLFNDGDWLSRQSVKSDLVILPFPYDGSDAGEMKPVLDDAARTMSRLPSVLMVRGQSFVKLSE